MRISLPSEVTSHVGASPNDMGKSGVTLTPPSVIDGVLTHSFEDVEGLLMACAKGMTEHRHNIISEYASPNFLGVRDMNAAFTLARTGWAEGAEASEKLFTSLQSQMAKSLVPVLISAEEPGTFDPASYYSGEEYYFAGHTPSDSVSEGRPEAITIYYDSFISGGCSADLQVKRGVTVAALAYILERSGIATAIYLSSRSALSDHADAKVDEVLFRVKAFGQPLVLPSVAFWLGHPCVDRAIVSGGVLSPWHRHDNYSPGPRRAEEANTVVVEPMVHSSTFNSEAYLTAQLKRFKLLNVEVEG